MHNDKLIILPDIEEFNIGSGICFIIDYYDDVLTYKEGLALKIEMHTFLEGKGWYSGCNIYPIDAGSGDAEYQYLSNENLWDVDTEYGRRRWEVYLHLDKFLCSLRGVDNVQQ